MSAVCRASDSSALSRTEARTTTAAKISVTSTLASTPTAIATNARARIDDMGLWLDGLVAGAADLANQVGPAELAAQLSDVDVDGSRAAGVVVAPHPLEQQVAREHGAAVL